MAKLVAGYGHDCVLNTVMEYGPDSSNPNLDHAQTRAKVQDDCPFIISADSWEELPEYYPFFPLYGQYLAYAKHKQFQPLGKLAYDALVASGFNPIINKWRIVRVDGTVIWRDKVDIDQFIAADVIAADSHGFGYYAKL